MSPDEQTALKTIVLLLVLEVVLLAAACYYAVAGNDLPVTPPVFGTKQAVPEPTPAPGLEGEDPRDVPAPTFFGEEITVEGDGIVYVLDASTSMSWGSGSGRVQWTSGVGSTLRNYMRPDGTWFKPLAPGTVSVGWPWNRAQIETIESISGLAENFKFNVYTFTCAPKPMWGELRPATAWNKAAAAAWVFHQRCGGGTGTGFAGAAALQHKDASTVVLLTDGQPGCSLSETGEYHRRMIRTANTQGAAVNVFGFRIGVGGRAWCQAVAAENGGKFVEVR